MDKSRTFEGRLAFLRCQIGTSLVPSRMRRGQSVWKDGQTVSLYRIVSLSLGLTPEIAPVGFIPKFQFCRSIREQGVQNVETAEFY